MEDFSKYLNQLRLKVSNGDIDALDQLYRYYFKKLKLYGLQFSSQLSSPGIEDVIQELFIWIAKNHKKLRDIDNLEVYLFSAFKKNIYQEIYKSQNRNQLKNRFLTSINSPTLEHSPEKIIIEAEKQAHQENYISKLLNTLPPKQKEVLYLRNYMNLSYRDIATIMDLSEQIVRNYGFRALQKLRAQTLNDFQKKEV